MMPNAKKLTLKATQKKGEPITGAAHFAMIELTALEGIQGLIDRAPQAARLLVSLIRRMSPGSAGVVVISREAMREILGVSMPTVERALRVLISEGWVHRIRIGSASALAINRQVAWMGPRGEIQHAIFDATVIASRSEQDEMSLNPPPMRRVPIFSQDQTLEKEAAFNKVSVGHVEGSKSNNQENEV